LPGLRCRFISIEINFLVFDAAPQTFDKYIVSPGPFAIHADLNAVVLQYEGESLAGIL
jgi:hypothetical protein